MRRPLKRGEAVSQARMKSWMADFGGYRHQVTETKIERWLDQFNEPHQDIAARILDSIDFIGRTQISNLFRDVLGAIPGWHNDPNRRKGRWRFVAYSGSAGESGDSMLHSFRIATRLDRKQHDEMFIHRRDLLIERLTPDDTVILIDDFSGTGKQVCNSWREIFQELLPAEPNIYLLLIGAAKKAIERIKEETELRPICGFELTEKDNIFHTKCRYFTKQEKEILLTYCGKADSKNPRGYGKCGFVVVFAHRCPNNTIPVIHTNHKKWIGLFPRHD